MRSSGFPSSLVLAAGMPWAPPIERLGLTRQLARRRVPCVQAARWKTRHTTFRLSTSLVSFPYHAKGLMPHLIGLFLGHFTSLLIASALLLSLTSLARCSFIIIRQERVYCHLACCLYMPFNSLLMAIAASITCFSTTPHIYSHCNAIAASDARSLRLYGADRNMLFKMMLPD